MRTHLLVLVAGASVLATEILGERLLAPFYGLGPFLGSVLMTVTLLGLAIGFVVGGRSAGADDERSIGLALLISGLWLLTAHWIQRPLLLRLEPIGLRLDVALAATLLLGPSIVLLGTILPRALRIASPGREPGIVAGPLCALFAVGAVAAALLLRFVLLPRWGVKQSLLMIALVQVGSGLASLASRFRARSAMVSTVLLIGLIGLYLWRDPTGAKAGAVVGVGFNGEREIRVLDKGGSRYLLADGNIHTVAEPGTWTGLRRPEAALELAILLIPPPGKALVIGSRGGSLAKRLSRAGWTVDVVDRDPAAARTAQAFFGLLPAEARVIHAEPREYLRRTHENYDAVVLDAFADSFVPLELVTREFFALTQRRLFQGGLLAIVVETMGWEDVLVRSLAATAGAVFDTVQAFPTGEPPNALGSVVLLAADRSLEIPEERIPQPFENLADPLEHWSAVQVSHAWSNQYAPDIRGVPLLGDDLNPAEGWGERINVAVRRDLHQFFGPRGGSW